MILINKHVNGKRTQVTFKDRANADKYVNGIVGGLDIRDAKVKVRGKIEQLFIVDELGIEFQFDFVTKAGK